MVFAILFAQTVLRLSLPPSDDTPISAQCGTHPAPFSQPPSPSSLSSSHPAGWSHGGEGRHEASCRYLSQTSGEGWGVCRERLLAMLHGAAGRDHGCLWCSLKTEPCPKESSGPEQPAFPTAACQGCHDTPGCSYRSRVEDSQMQCDRHTKEIWPESFQISCLWTPRTCLCSYCRVLQIPPLPQLPSRCFFLPACIACSQDHEAPSVCGNKVSPSSHRPPFPTLPFVLLSE